MIAFMVVVFDIFFQRSPQLPWSEEDHPLETFRFEASHEPFLVRIQIGTAGWQQNNLGVRLRSKKFSQSDKAGIAIHDQVRSIFQEAVNVVGQFTASLLHPFCVRVGRNTGDLHSARLQFHHHHDVMRHQPTRRPDFHSGEISGEQCFPVGFQKG